MSRYNLIELIELGDLVIKEYYLPYNSHFHGYDHILRTIMSGFIFLGVYKELSNEPIEELIAPVFYSCLFHDTGRKGRDGPDLWEKQSANIAERVLREVKEDEKLIDDVRNSIDIYNDEKLLDSIAKGADSLDIMRVLDYERGYNPFYKYLSNKYPEKLEYINEVMKELEEEHLQIVDFTQQLKRGEIQLKKTKLFQEERKSFFVTDFIMFYKKIYKKFPIIRRYLSQYEF